MQFKLLPILTLLVCINISLPSKAHTDHQEIQVKSAFQVNQRQELNIITMSWVYDTFASTDMLSHQNDIDLLAKILVSDLSRFNFFTHLNADGRRISSNNVSQYKLIKAKDRHNNPVLQLTFTLVLKQPLSTKSLKKIDIVHVDPTNRSLFYYDDAKDIILSNELKSKCSALLSDKAEFKEGEFPQIAAINCQA